MMTLFCTVYEFIINWIWIQFDDGVFGDSIDSVSNLKSIDLPPPIDSGLTHRNINQIKLLKLINWIQFFKRSNNPLKN